jgi:hypothetical protein
LEAHCPIVALCTNRMVHFVRLADLSSSIPSRIGIEKRSTGFAGSRSRRFLEIFGCSGLCLATVSGGNHIPGGAVRAALRVRALFPHSSLAGWILIMCAPFYSVVVLVALVGVTQVAGNTLLFVGTAMVVCSPWIYVARGSLFVGLSTPAVEKQSVLTYRIGSGTFKLGVVVVVIWALTAYVSGIRPVGESKGAEDTGISLLTYGEAVRVVLELIGRLLVTTILFADLILAMVLRNCLDERKRRDTFGEQSDVDFHALEKAIGQETKSLRTKDQLTKHSNNDSLEPTASVDCERMDDSTGNSDNSTETEHAPTEVALQDEEINSYLKDRNRRLGGDENV